MNINEPKKEKIIKIKIPDEEISNWIDTLKKEDFSEKEIDYILSNLNKKYKESKMTSEEKIINEILMNMQKYVAEKYNTLFFITKEEKDILEKKCISLMEKIKKEYKIDFNKEIETDLLKETLTLIIKEVVDKNFGP